MVLTSKLQGLAQNLSLLAVTH